MRIPYTATPERDRETESKAYRYYCDSCGVEMDATIYSMRQQREGKCTRCLRNAGTPYPMFCYTPDECRGLTSCRKSPACSE